MNDAVSRACPGLFPGEGEMVRRVNEKDWGQTLLGPAANWPASIRTAVSLSLKSDFQVLVLAGPELVYIYNDATIPIFGDKHPWALGQRVEDVWPEAWDTLGPMLAGVYETGKTTRHDDLLLVLNRAGFAEECYFTFSYSAIHEEPDRTTGVFVATMETTARVRGERRWRTLTELATQVARRGHEEGMLEPVRQALSANLYDLPLTALYLFDADGGQAEQAFCTGAPANRLLLPQRLAWPGEGGPLACLARSSAPQLIDASVLLAPVREHGSGAVPPRQVMALPFIAPGGSRPRGIMLVALNPLAPLDDAYREFIDAAAGLVTTAVANADAFAAERRRPAPQEAQAAPSYPGLTARETEIVSLIGAGMQVKQVAAELGISISSVNTYRTRVFRKMGLNSNAGLIRYALKAGLVS